MKQRKNSPDPITGHTKQSAGIVFIGVLGSALFALFVGMLPSYSVIFSYIAIPPTLALAGSLIWLNIKPSLWATFIKYTSFSITLALISFRMISFLAPGLSLILGISISLSVILAITLPLWNSRITSLIKNELYTPTTPTGKFILKYSLLILPFGGVIGSGLYTIFRGSLNRSLYLAIILGPLAWFLALILPFSSRHPQSPWEYKLKLESKKSD